MHEFIEWATSPGAQSTKASGSVGAAFEAQVIETLKARYPRHYKITDAQKPEQTLVDDESVVRWAAGTGKARRR